MARESGWMNTSFHGNQAVMMYLGDWERGLNFEYASVYEYLRKNAMDPRGPRRNLEEYLQKGWIHDMVVAHPSPPYAGGNAGGTRLWNTVGTITRSRFSPKSSARRTTIKCFLPARTITPTFSTPPLASCGTPEQRAKYVANAAPLKPGENRKQVRAAFALTVNVAVFLAEALVRTALDKHLAQF